MRTQFFFVHEFTPESRRTKPIGAWIRTEDGSVDYLFSPDYPEDEQLASDVVNRLIESGIGAVGEDFLEYWRDHVGYSRSASGIEWREGKSYPEIIADLTKSCL